MYIALIILPFLGSIASGFFGRKIAVIGSRLINASLALYRLRGTVDRIFLIMNIALIILFTLGSTASGFFGRKIAVIGSRLINSSLALYRLRGTVDRIFLIMNIALIILFTLGSTVSGFLGRKIAVTGSRLINSSLSLIFTGLLAALGFIFVINNVFGDFISFDVISFNNYLCFSPAFICLKNNRDEPTEVIIEDKLTVDPKYSNNNFMETFTKDRCNTLPDKQSADSAVQNIKSEYTKLMQRMEQILLSGVEDSEERSKISEDQKRRLEEDLSYVDKGLLLSKHFVEENTQDENNDDDSNPPSEPGLGPSDPSIDSSDNGVDTSNSNTEGSSSKFSGLIDILDNILEKLEDIFK